MELDLTTVHRFHWTEIALGLSFAMVMVAVAVAIIKATFWGMDI